MINSKTIISILYILFAGAIISASAQKPFFNTMPVKIQNISINNNLNQGIPAIVDGMLYYPTQTNNNTQPTQQYPPTSNTNTFYKLYALPLGNIKSTNPQQKPLTEFNQNYHTGPVSYCPTTGELFVTQSNNQNTLNKNTLFGIKQNITLKIYIYTYQNQQWTLQSQFIHNSPYYSLAHPSINASGDTLFFASDMPGGYGKSDIYYCIRKNNQWTAPINAGPNINTPKNEITPCIHNANQLFFASNKRGGHGKFDIYTAKFSKSSFSKSQNAGPVINSRANDYGLVLHPQKPIAFFVSNRKLHNKSDNILSITHTNYTPQHTPLYLAQQTINQKINLINQQLQQLAKKMAQTQYISQNVQFTCTHSITQQHTSPNLTIHFTYTLKTDTLKAPLNSYSLSQYTTQHSHPVTILLQTINHHVKNTLAPYLCHQQNISLNIHTNTDAINVFNNTRYLGEYGPKLSAKIQTPDSIVDINLKQNQTINNMQLAYLRAVGIHHYIQQNIATWPTQISKVNYSINTQNTKHKTQAYHTSISITIHNPFANY